MGEDGTGFYRFSVLGLAEGERWQAGPRLSPPHDLLLPFSISVRVRRVERQGVSGDFGILSHGEDKMLFLARQLLALRAS